MSAYTFGTFTKKPKTLASNANNYTPSKTYTPTNGNNFTPAKPTVTQTKTTVTTPKTPYGIASMANGTTLYSDKSTQPNANLPKPQAQPTPSYLDTFYKDYLGQIGKQESDRKTLSDQEQQAMTDESNSAISQQEAVANSVKKMLEGQRPVFKKRSEATQALIKKGLDAVNAQGAQAKANITDQSGETLRQQAMTKRESDSKRNALFANNNTSESYGVGGYQLEQTNADSDFQREQNKTLRSRDMQLADIDNQLVSAQSTAEQAINDEVGKYEDALYEIEVKLGENEAAKANAQYAAMSDLRKNLFAIRNQYNTDTSGLFKTKMEVMKAYLDDSVKSMDTSQANKDVDALRQEYITRIEKSGFPDVYNSYKKIMSTSDSAAGDLSMIFAYMKLLDPTSVVREGEFATAQNSGSVPTAVANAYNKALKGERLQPGQREDFRSSAKTIFNQYKSTADQYTQQYQGMAQGRGLDASSISNMYSGFNENLPESSSPKWEILSVE